MRGPARGWEGEREPTPWPRPRIAVGGRRVFWTLLEIGPHQIASAFFHFKNGADPEWAPYWTNYKMLKKFLKALVPPDAPERAPRAEETDGAAAAARMSADPGEKAFFRLLNAELRKAVHFFDQAQLEYEIRERRVREGIAIMRGANSFMVSEKWTSMAKSLYRLYKDLLLLETYAIMTYCSFSKILKKHDKVTRHVTRVSFMKNVVNKASFTHYPRLLAMISRVQRLYDEVSRMLASAGKSELCEDERLFINMVQRLNTQVLDTAEDEGAPDVEGRKVQRRPSSPERLLVELGDGRSPGSSRSSLSSPCEVDTLRSLVEENAMNASSKEGTDRVADPCASARTRRDERGDAAAEPGVLASEGTQDKELSSVSADSGAASEPVTKRARLET